MRVLFRDYVRKAKLEKSNTKFKEHKTRIFKCKSMNIAAKFARKKFKITKEFHFSIKSKVYTFQSKSKSTMIHRKIKSLSL